MKFSTIDKYNDYLIQNLIKIEFKAYFSESHKQFYDSKYNSFIDYLFSLRDCKDDDFCIPHYKLCEYGIIGNMRDSYSTKRKIEYADLDEGIDYEVITVQIDHPRKNNTYKNIYMFNANAFEILLTRAPIHPNQPINVKIYYKYFRFEKKATSYYIQYKDRLSTAINK